MKSLELKKINSLTFDRETVSSIKHIGEFKGKQELYYKQSPEVLKCLVENAKIESTVSSNRIEGITAPQKVIEGMILKAVEPKNRSEKEIAGYRDALALIHEVHSNMPFTNNVILQLHSMLYRYEGEDKGRWKTSENEITEISSDGTKRIRFKPVSAFDTPRYMDLLIEHYKIAVEKERVEPLVVIPLTVLDFLCVHPFNDGNGRTARLLTLLLLYHFGYEVGRYISLERIIEESKETYYETLGKSSVGWHEGKHDVFPWLDYFYGVLLRSYKEFEDRVITVKTGKGEKADMIRNSVMNKFLPFSISDIQKECRGISREMVRLILRQMRDEGIIVSTGKGRGAKWIKKESK